MEEDGDDQQILKLANLIMRNIGIQHTYDEVDFLFTDSFYIEFYQKAYPSKLDDLFIGCDEEEMAQNVQQIVDHVYETIPIPEDLK